MTIVPHRAFETDPQAAQPKGKKGAPQSENGARSFGMPHAAAGGSYVLMDLVVLAGVIFATGAVIADVSTSSVVGRVLLFAGTVHIGLKTAMALYPGFGLHPDARLRKSMMAWAGAGAIAIAAMLYLMPFSWIVLGSFVVSFAALGLFQTFGRMLARVLLRRVGALGVPVHVVGLPDAIRSVEAYLNAYPAVGLRVVAQERPVGTVLWAADHLPSVATLDALRRGGQDVIMVSDLPRCRLSGVHPAEHRGEIGLHLSRAQSWHAGGALKRLFDLVLVLPIAVFALPVVFFAALLIRIVDPGPAFYVQSREGYRGKKIGVLKLRTMYLDSDRMLKDLLERDPAVRAEWEAHFKLRSDPRILPYIGTFLRASSLDELPQLWNVLRGEMSLVGPRPFPHYHLDAMPKEFRSLRASVVPGLTGLWQVSERSSADLEGQQELDQYYINGRSFWGDVSILLRTFGAVLGRRGAY